MKRTSKERRAEAVERMKRSLWTDSKAKRKGTRTQDQWLAWRDDEIERLEDIR